MTKKHLLDIQILTGLAIVLVVIGHIIPIDVSKTEGLETFHFLKTYIYSFHMPLFIFVSGYLMYYTFPDFKKAKSRQLYVKKKIIRLLPSYLFFSSLIFLSKYTLGKQIHIDNPISGIDEALKIFYIPFKSFARYLWYIYILFFYYLTIPFILKYLTLVQFFLVSIIISFFKFPEYFALNLYVEFLPFLLLGCIAIREDEKYKTLIQNYGVYFITIFMLASVIYYFQKLPKEFMGGLSILAFHSLVLKLNLKKTTLLKLFGKYTFSIYLMHSIVIGVIKAIGFKYFGFNYDNFILLFILLIISGLFIPILIKKFIINKIPIINKYIG